MFKFYQEYSVNIYHRLAIYDRYIRVIPRDSASTYGRIFRCV
uniref:Uncharacterized protein n=1 Tax=Anguilla anguilla TaxID=7936 RepID=A0A0E9XCF5_ANGAN